MSQIKDIVRIYGGSLKLINTEEDLKTELNLVKNRGKINSEITMKKEGSEEVKLEDIKVNAFTIPELDTIPPEIDLLDNEVDITDAKNLLDKIVESSEGTLILDQDKFDDLMNTFNGTPKKLDIGRVVNSNLSEEAKLKVVKKIADYKKIEYHPNIKLAGLLKKIEE